MERTKIRWAENTWNPFYGCTKISPGCDRCYAEVIAEKFNHGGTGFQPRFVPHKVGDPKKWAKKGAIRIFCNSMSDPFHTDFTDAQRDEVMAMMVDVGAHDYLLLTKRPQAMHRYFCDDDGWLARTGHTEVPPQIWLGASVESDRYTFRADWLRRIPALVRFLSCEPLLAPLPSLDLDGIGWVIVGGESGSGYRPMNHAWARDLRDRCDDAGVAYYFKQSSAFRTEMGIELDGVLHEEYPLAHPADHGGDRRLGRFVGRHAAARLELL